MIIWGGSKPNQRLNSGGKYNPSTDSWVAITTTGALTKRDSHTAVWTGSEMIVWGGAHNESSIFNTGGKYNPNTKNWIVTTTTDAPDGRSLSTRGSVDWN